MSAEISTIYDALKVALSGTPKDDVSGAVAQETQYTEEQQKIELLREDVETRKESNRLLRQNREERKKFARQIFILTCIWTFLIFFILIANGIKCINDRQYWEFYLSDSVLITLITTTTINFFGFFLLVVKYLFHIDGEHKKEPDAPAPPATVGTFNQG